MPLKLVSFDMDGTLLRNINSVHFLCRVHQQTAAAEQIDDLYRRKQLDWIESDYRKALLLAGLSLADVSVQFEQYVHVIDNFDKVIRRLQQVGVRTVIITAGPVAVARVLAEKYGLDDVFGSQYEIRDGLFTGRILDHLGREGKLRGLEHFCHRWQLQPEDFAAVGDAGSDLVIFRRCGLSVAINYTASLEGQADHYYRTEDLMDILEVLLAAA